MNKNNSVSRTRILAEISVFTALSAVLYAIRPFSLPYGGAVTLGSMIPVVALSLRRGVYAGVIAGALFGVLALFIDILLLPFSPIATPIQAVLEYPLAFAVLGVSGMFRKESVVSTIAGLSVSVFVKFLIHYLVGVFIWFSVYSFPPEWGQYLWPAVYNGSFLIVEFIITAIVIIVLIKRGTLTYAL